MKADAGGGARVFLLDDEPAVQAIMKRELQSAGFNVLGSTEWSDVAKKVFAIKEGWLILVADLNMPGIRGEDFCRTILQYRKEFVRLILYTGVDRAEAEAVAERLGGGIPVVLKEEGARRLCEVVRSVARKPSRQVEASPPP